MSPLLNVLSSIFFLLPPNSWHATTFFTSDNPLPTIAGATLDASTPLGWFRFPKSSQIHLKLFSSVKSFCAFLMVGTEFDEQYDLPVPLHPC